MAFPHYFWLPGWTIAAFLAAIPQWLFTLAMGRPARPLHRFLSSYLRYSARVNAYLLLAANRFPTFLGRRGGHPVDLAVPGAERQRRWKTLLRPALAIPAVVFSQVLGTVAEIVALLAWFVCVALGRIPKGMRDLNAYCVRYQQQTLGYLLFVTDRFPQLAGAESYATF